MEFKTYGFENIYEALDGIDLEKHKDITKKWMSGIGQIIKDSTVVKTPEDTGALKASWYFKTLTPLSVLIYNEQKYAPFVEDGHKTRSGSFVVGAKMLDLAMMETSSIQIPQFINIELSKLKKGFK